MIRANLGWTIDELALRAGVTSRTIRAHQTAGLLPPPRRQGRTAYYGDEHAGRLQAIGRLQARGWSRAAIRDVLAARDAGCPLDALLDVPAMPTSAEPPADWADELFAGHLGPADPVPAGAWN
jgi:DNA-binding transcriptional MerR regulator